MRTFTENELKIYRQSLLNKKSKEIAKEMGVSEAYISQTIKKIDEKIRSLNDSMPLLAEMGIVDQITPLRLTNKGRSKVVKVRSEMATRRESYKKKNDVYIFKRDIFKTFLSRYKRRIPGIIRDWDAYRQNAVRHGLRKLSDVNARLELDA